MNIVAILILLVAVILFMQGRKRGDTRQAATIRKIALGLGLLALALAIVGALDIGQGDAAGDTAPVTDGGGI